MEAAHIINRFEQLESERTTLDNTLHLIERFVVPFTGSYYAELQNENELDWRRRGLYDGTAVVDCDLLASALASNLIPFSQQWFQLSFQDDDLNDNQAARAWLDECEQRTYKAVQESDFIAEGNKVMSEICSYATALFITEENERPPSGRFDGMNYTAADLDTAYFELDALNFVAGFYMEKRWTSLQIISKFPDAKDILGISEEDPVDKRRDLIFAIYTRQAKRDADVTRKLAPKERPVGYKWVDKATGAVLAEGGYYHMPVTRPVWKETARSKFGFSPAMLALSDIIQLNDYVASKSEAAAKALDPAYWTTSRGVIGDLDLRSGGLTMLQSKDEIGLLEDGTKWAVAINEEERLQEAIHRYFLQDVLDLKESPAMTATEVMARLDKMREHFGPIVGGLERSFLKPVIEATFTTLLREGELPAMPESAMEADLDVEFTGRLSKIMRSGEADAAQMWLAMVMELSQFKPEAFDNVDVDALTIGVAEARGVPAKYRIGDTERDKLRKDRQVEEEQVKQIAATAEGGKALQEAGAGIRAVEEVEAA